ncbi:MAG TPA: class I SAM-dependent methyltransferase [Streptosporangiaceae bacterium]|jgi:ubiquinone/menaquinone biosynthesis C-methylase UbiE
MAESWMLDELAYAGPEHLDAGFVAGFDRKQGTDPAEAIEVLREHGLNQDSVLVDLGAGTGTLTLAAAPLCARVVAADVSAPMLDFLRRRAEAAGLRNVRCVQAGFLSYQHEGPPADFVYTRNALHQLPDFWKAIALTRIASMLAPGGVLRVEDLIYDFEPAQASAVFAEWFDGAVSDPAEGYTSADYAEHIRTEHSTFRWLFEPMLAAAGFTIARVSYDASLYGDYVCVRQPATGRPPG